MKDKTKKIGKWLGSAALTFLILVFFRQVVFKEDREKEQRAYYISTVTSYEANLNTVIRMDKRIKKEKKEMQKTEKNSKEYNRLIEVIRIEKKIYSYLHTMFKYIYIK